MGGTLVSLASLLLKYPGIEYPSSSGLILCLIPAVYYSDQLAKYVTYNPASVESLLEIYVNSGTCSNITCLFAKLKFLILSFIT